MHNIQNIIKYTQDLKLLYVEDHQDTRESTLLALENLFDNIIVGVDGKDGLDKFMNNSNIDIIISDINMPHMDGLEMSKEILAIQPNIPIFIFSAHNESNYFVDAIKIGVEGYLLKPLNMEQFLQVLTKTLEKIKLRKENFEYKVSLEYKVQQQVDQLLKQDQLLLQNSKMAAMGEMIDIIAHQWTQPLNTISMRADFMSECAKDDEEISNEEIIACSEGIVNQVKHLVTTLNEFRSFFRPSTKVESINLQTMFDSLSVLLKDNLIKHQIKLDYNFDNIYFNANKNEFKHIFINLINNSRDAFVQNEIEAREIKIEAYEANNNIIITIQDNAGGIPNNILTNIFEQNFTTKADTGGTGIGLYMCKAIANKYHANITVESKDNNTIFTLKIKKSTHA